MTSATPVSSRDDGICVSTTTPITVAVAGSSETISAYVARLRRDMASWSKTYGMTEEATPTPTPAASAIGSSNAGATLKPPIGVTNTVATNIAMARPSIRASSQRRAMRCASTM
jgi:hypothetical protein